MKKLTLDHSLTPANLKELNQQLSELFEASPIDEMTLLELVEKRDVIIQTHLEACNKTQQKAFAKAELDVNGVLVAYTKNLAKVSLKQLSDLIRGRKAVKKYK
ncbi:MAG: hypothetical protein GW763_09625 [Paraglaciecola sp.]|nr:hypothetical protein [Paraglaciecola sp.]NCT48228.1 hypothetical protein [Paraglaciecola sp.]